MLQATGQPTEVTRTIDEERAHRKARLAAALRLFAKFGLLDGFAGHISARDPEHPDCYWMNPSDRHWSLLRVSDLVLVGPDGQPVEAGHRVNAAGVAIHGQILR